LAAYLVKLLLPDSSPTEERYNSIETTNIVDFTRRDGMSDALTELLITGAQDLITRALETELSGYMAQFTGLRTDVGHAAVVRNGHHPAAHFKRALAL
jgi:putative transposase